MGYFYTTDPQCSTLLQLMEIYAKPYPNIHRKVFTDEGFFMSPAEVILMITCWVAHFCALLFFVQRNNLLLYNDLLKDAVLRVNNFAMVNCNISCLLGTQVM